MSVRESIHEFPQLTHASTAKCQKYATQVIAGQWVQMSLNESKSFTSTCRFLATLRPWSWQHPRARTSWSESRSKVATQLANATSRSREQKFIERQTMSSIQYQALKVWWRGCGEEEDLDRFSLATSAASQCNRISIQTSGVKVTKVRVGCCHEVENGAQTWSLHGAWAELPRTLARNVPKCTLHCYCYIELNYFDTSISHPHAIQSWAHLQSDLSSVKIEQY